MEASSVVRTSRLLAALDARGLVTTALTMVSVLLTFATALVLEHYEHLHADIAVLAVVMAMTLSRNAAEPGPAEFMRRLVTLPIVAYLASQVGRLMLHHVAVGDTLFVLALTSSVWLRRFGPQARRVARLITLPFIGVLVVPVPISAATASSLWPVAISVIALGWVTLVAAAAQQFGHPAPPEAIPTPAALQPASVRLWNPRSWPASSKMALQLAVGLAVAFLVGHHFYPQHWSWVVLSCFLVCSGNRGRGDVLHKGIQRLIGASVGTVSATLIAGHIAAGDHTAIVLIFGDLAIATWLRRRSYAFWAAGVTAALALLNGYYGITGSHELVQRLGGVITGAAIGVAASWWLLPVRSGDVFRRRVADGLAALTAYLTALRIDADAVPVAAEAYEHRVALLNQLLPALRLHHRTVARVAGTSDVHAVQVIGILAELGTALPAVEGHVAAYPPSARTLGEMAKQSGVIRRRMIQSQPSESVPVETTDQTLAPAVEALNRLDAAFTPDLWRRHGGYRKPS
jgi:uncharacterized membrane protein YccC